MSGPPSLRRPLVMRIVRWGVAVLGLWNLGRAVTLWTQKEWLESLSPSPPSEYRFAIASVWAAAFLISAAGFWRWSWLRRLIPILVALYGVYEMSLLIVYAQVTPGPLTIILYLSFICFTEWVLWRHSSIPSYRSQQKGGP